MKQIKTTPIAIIALIIPLVTILFIYFICNFPRNIHDYPKKFTYIISQNQTLWNIGEQYCGNNDIREWIDRTCDINKINDVGNIQPGQKIVIEDWSK